ncbi:unnamed protein product, partial [Ectocarpus sp. 8 AP-2014]
PRLVPNWLLLLSPSVALLGSFRLREKPPSLCFSRRFAPPQATLVQPGISRGDVAGAPSSVLFHPQRPIAQPTTSARSKSYTSITECPSARTVLRHSSVLP